MASVGSGPAIDVVSRLPPIVTGPGQSLACDVAGLDGEALVRRQIEFPPIWTTAIGYRLSKATFFALAKALAGLALQGCDSSFVPAVDYLQHPGGPWMLREFWNRLAPRRWAFVFNFAHHNPTRAYMEWLGNWYLLYRSEAELAALATAAEIPTDLWKLSPAAWHRPVRHPEQTSFLRRTYLAGLTGPVG